jgi:hypothetical protein
MSNIEFAEKYGYILNPSTGYHLIELNEFQKIVLRNLDDERLPKTIIDSTRQSGISTTLAIHISRFLIYNNGDKNIICIKSPNIKSSKYLLEKIKIILDKFYRGNRDCFINYNATSIKTINGNEVRVINEAFFCGDNNIKNIHSLIIDSAFFVHKLDEWIDEFNQNPDMDLIKLILASTDEVFGESNIKNTIK